MDYEQIIKDIILPFVDDKDAIQVQSVSDNKSISINVYGNKNDMGRLIGHNGRVASAIREVANVAAKIDGKFLNVKFDSFKNKDNE